MEVLTNKLNKMKAIWKYPLILTGEQNVTMPVESKILSVINQAGGNIVLYALVNTGNVSRVVREIVIVGTGNPFPEDEENLVFIGTVEQGYFVWHIFERIKA